MVYQAIQNSIENERRDDYLKAINDKDNLCEFLDGGIVNILELIGLHLNYCKK